VIHPDRTSELTRLLGVRYPLLQGGMTFGSDGRLVAAVSAAGALGTLGTFHYRTWEEVRAQLAVIRASTSAPFGVNRPFFERALELMERACDEGVRIFTLGGWASEDALRLKERYGLVLLASVNSATAARTLEPFPVDALIAQGCESGGANSQHPTRALLEYLLEHHAAPIVAAGGLWDGHDLFVARLAGAAGIQLGTRFLFAEESPLHPTIKHQVVASASKRAPVTQLVPVGDTLHMRFLVNPPFKQKSRDGELQRIFADKSRVWELSSELVKPQDGPILLYAGSGVHRLRAIEPAADIVGAIAREHDALARRVVPPLGA
jgi:enoyl-[acyl-carrier protein] reductase II